MFYVQVQFIRISHYAAVKHKLELLIILSLSKPTKTVSYRKTITVACIDHN